MFKEVSSVLYLLAHEHSIRDYFRIGKYSVDRAKPRLIIFLFIGSSCVGIVRENKYEDMQIKTNELVQPLADDKEPESSPCPKKSDVFPVQEPFPTFHYYPTSPSPLFQTSTSIVPLTYFSVLRQ